MLKIYLEQIEINYLFKMISILQKSQQFGNEVLFPLLIQYIWSVPKEWSNHQVVIYSVIEVAEKHSQAFKISFSSFSILQKGSQD